MITRLTGTRDQCGNLIEKEKFKKINNLLCYKLTYTGIEAFVPAFVYVCIDD